MLHWVFSCSHSLLWAPEIGAAEVTLHLNLRGLRKKRQLIICRSWQHHLTRLTSHFWVAPGGLLCFHSKTRPTSCANSSDTSRSAWETHPHASTMHLAAFGDSVTPAQPGAGPCSWIRGKWPCLLMTARKVGPKPVLDSGCGLWVLFVAGDWGWFVYTFHIKEKFSSPKPYFRVP